MSNSSRREIEDRGYASTTTVTVRPPPGSRVRIGYGRPSTSSRPIGNLKPLGYALAGTVIALGLYNAFKSDWNLNRRATQPTSPPQPNDPPQAVDSREEHDDLGSVSRAQTYIWTILLTVSSLPLVSHRPEPLVVSIGEGKSKESGPAISTHAHHRRASSPLDLLSRADLEEGLVLFSRMLDELD